MQNVIMLYQCCDILKVDYFGVILYGSVVVFEGKHTKREAEHKMGLYLRIGVSLFNFIIDLIWS